jgi:chromosome segregation ATPase
VNNSIPTQTVHPADEKARLECEQIRAEIEATRKPFYKVSSFYTAIAPVALAILGVLFTWASGWFDVQRTRINNEKLLVQVQTERLQNETRMQTEHLVVVDREVESLRSEKLALTNQITLLERERAEIRSAASYFQTQAERLAGSETNSLRMLYDLQSVQAERKAALLEIDGLQKTNALLRTALKERDATFERAITFLQKKAIENHDDHALNLLLDLVSEIRPPRRNPPPIQHE